MRKRKRLAKEKVKRWKKALREYDQVSEQDIVTPVEQQAREALEAPDAADLRQHGFPIKFGPRVGPFFSCFLRKFMV